MMETHRHAQNKNWFLSAHLLFSCFYVLCYIRSHRSQSHPPLPRQWWWAYLHLLVSRATWNSFRYFWVSLVRNDLNCSVLDLINCAFFLSAYSWKISLRVLFFSSFHWIIFVKQSKVMLPDSFPWVVYVLVAASMAWSCYQRAMLYAKSWDQWHPWVVCSSSLVGWAWLGMPNRIDGNERFSWSQSAGNMEKRKLSTCVR